MIYNTSFYPVVLEVNGQPDLSIHSIDSKKPESQSDKEFNAGVLDLTKDLLKLLTSRRNEASALHQTLNEASENVGMFK